MRSPVTSTPVHLDDDSIVAWKALVAGRALAMWPGWLQQQHGDAAGFGFSASYSGS